MMKRVWGWSGVFLECKLYSPPYSRNGGHLGMMDNKVETTDLGFRVLGGGRGGAVQGV